MLCSPDEAVALPGGGFAVTDHRSGAVRRVAPDGMISTACAVAPGDETQCPRCGEFLGRVNVLPPEGMMIDKRELRCRCEGIACRSCGTGMVQRPLSDHFDPERRAGHCHGFGYLVPCGACQAAGRGPRVLMSLDMGAGSR